MFAGLYVHLNDLRWSAMDTNYKAACRLQMIQVMEYLENHQE